MFPKLEFQQLVKDIGAEHHTRGFSSWKYVVPMLFILLAG